MARRTLTWLPQLTGLILVMAGAAMWATVGVATELVPEQAGLPREVFGFMRTLIAAPAILLAVFVGGGRKSLLPCRGSLPDFVTFGLCCAVFQMCLFRSFELLGVTVTVFLTVCLPPLISIAAAALRKTERVSPHVLFAFLLGAAGLLAFLGGDFEGRDKASAIMGLAQSFAASVAFVLMTECGRKLALRHSSLLIAGYGLLGAAAVLLPCAWLFAPADAHLLVFAIGGWKGVGVLLYLGLVPTALAYVCYCGGMARCPSAMTGLVASMIEPAFAAALAFFLLHEALSSLQMWGCAGLLGAMLVLARGNLRPSAFTPARQNSGATAA